MLELNKIYCMDCFEGMKLLDDNSVDLVVTDPPYPIDRDNGSGRLLFKDHPQEKEWFEETYVNWDNFLHSFLSEIKRITKPSSHIYIY